MNKLTRQAAIRQIDASTNYGRSYYLCRLFAVPAREITFAAARVGLHPNHLTLLSLAVGLGAAWMLLQGGRMQLMYGGALIYLSYVLDYADGQLARWTGKVSPFGGWLDQVSDRVKEFFIILGASWGDYFITGEIISLALGFAAMFFLFMLEYYDQMARKIPAPKNSGTATAVKPSAVKRRSFVFDFTIDEQYALFTVCALAGQPRLLLAGATLLGGLLLVYKPLRGWQRYFSSVGE